MENISYGCMKDFFKLGNSGKDKAMSQKLAKSMVQEKYSNGEVICRIGDKADAMYFIESGKVEVIGSNKQLLNEMEQGQYFGEYAIMTGDKRLSTVRSKGGTVVYRLKRKQVMIARQQQNSFFGASFSLSLSLCDLCLFPLSFLFTEASEEECLFVDALTQSVAVDDTSEAIFMRYWKCENTVSYWTESLAEFLRLY